MSNCANREGDTKLFVALDNEGRRLLAIFEALRAGEVAAAKRSPSAPGSGRHPAHLNTEEGSADVQSKSAAAWHALRAHYYAMREAKKSISRVA